MVKNLINNIDFKELSKSCKDERDLSNLTKEFMKNRDRLRPFIIPCQLI
jgi:hypothetical protein